MKNLKRKNKKTEIPTWKRVINALALNTRYYAGNLFGTYSFRTGFENFNATLHRCPPASMNAMH